MTTLSAGLRPSRSTFGPGLLVLLTIAPSIEAQQDGVASTLHNLSVSGPGEVKSERETEVCKFCHVPHNSVVPEPLWGHALSAVRQYRVPDVGGKNSARQPAPQPDGSSRLCLSCHDGTVALGDIVGETEPIRMAGAQHLTPDRRGYLGTDLTGSHPISFEIPETDRSGADSSADMGHKPRSVIVGEGVVHLDKDGKMQCTTCHDPHSDRYYDADRVPRFWVKPTVEEVCLACHALR